MTATMKQILTAARASGKSAFIPFVMAGDPDMATSEKIIIALQQAGADMLELGVPFSDPAADGVTVQRAAERSLRSGTTLHGVMELVKKLRSKGVTMPICLFSYLNPVYQLGYETFIKQAQAAGAQGALIVDLPPEEAADYLQATRAHHFETVFLCSPTTSAARLKLIDAASSGFVYYVSREGVTGAQNALPQQLQDKLSALRSSMTNPIAVGFGISTPDQVRQLDGKADGIVVGSALVKLIEENQNDPVEIVAKSVRGLRGAGEIARRL